MHHEEKSESTSAAKDAVEHEHRDDDGYEAFLTSIRDTFTRLTASGGPLFTTATGDLFASFLWTLPQARQKHYDCRTCRRFLETYGSLVTVLADGTAVPVMWDPATAPTFFAKTVQHLWNMVRHAKINGVFLSRETAWGLASNEDPGRPVGRDWLPAKAAGEWFHMAVVPAESRVFAHATLSARQAMAERHEEHGMLGRGIGAFPATVVRQAHTYLKSGHLYRPEKCLGVAEWLLALHESLDATSNPNAREGLLWRAAATAPGGFCHVKTTVIGPLLEDIAAGLPFEDIRRKFNAKTDPDVYGHSTAAPTAGNVAAAEKVITQLGAAGSLERRYARFDEIREMVWKPRETKGTPNASKASGVFSHLLHREAPTGRLEIPPILMTWEKFARTVLQGATSIEVQIPASSARFAALVTAGQPDAPPILQWDSVEKRNPFSWYYAGGIDAEIKRRVVQAGGVHEGCDIRASLMWNNRNDLDLHVITPGREHIFFNAKRSRCGGWLDVDMNVRGETTTPIENTRWTRGMARAGHYRVYVQNYRFHERDESVTPFRVELEVNGDVFHYNGAISPEGEVGLYSDVTVADFLYTPGERLAAAPHGMQATQSASPSAWGVTPGQWVKVTGIVESPNMWGCTPMPQHGQHMFFLLDGCRDTAQGVGRGFFVETLNGELRPIRSTLEAHMATTPILGAEEASACGLGMNDQSPWDLVVRVQTEHATSTYRLERRD